jgi:serine/threonine protein kinase/predicted Zn-dependent protease
VTTQCPKCQTENPDTLKFCGECGTPLPSHKDIEVTETMETPKEELTTGSTFANRYQIIEELGKGGMGKVYKVHDTKIKEKIALKLIKPEIAKDKKTIERFSNELKFARKIRHKNICQMFDLGEDRGSHFITMEFVEGQDLKKLIRQSGQLAIGTTINIAKQVCDGLVEAHESGVIHRDLKPSNIMIDADGNARIMDFGIARSIEGKSITGAGVMIGTPDYMSPEQVDGKETDQRSDVYSLGVILYEMVTGRAPFEGDTALSIAVKHKTETPPDPRKYNEQISEELSQIIMRCLEKDKENRFQNAVELRKAISDIEQGIPTTEKVIPKKEPLTSREITVQLSPKKLLIPAIVIIAIVAVGLILWQMLSKPKTAALTPSGKPSLAVMYFQNNTGDQNFDIWRDGLSRMLIADLSQSKYIRIVSDDQLYGILSQLNLLGANNYSTEDLKEVASRGRSTHILRGILTKSGDSFRINTTLQESRTMEIVGSEMVEGKGEGSLHTMVDELTRKIKENFKLTEDEIASDIDKEVGIITTISPEAFKYYSEGRKFYRRAEWNQCIQLMKRAIAIDPEFAMAYRSLAMAYFNSSNTTEERLYRRKAMELVDRLSDREKFLVQAEYYRISERTYDIAIEAYKKLLQLYPEDWIGNNYLGNLYTYIEEWEKAIEGLEVNINNKVEAIQSYVNMSRAYMSLGLYDRAQEVLENYLKNISENYLIRDHLVLNYLSLGKYELALSEVEKSFLLRPGRIYKPYLGEIFQLKGDFINAEKEYSIRLESENKIDHLRSLWSLVYLYLQEGKFEKSKDFSIRGIELAKELGQMIWEERFHSSLARIYLITGNPDAALKEYNEMWKIAVDEDSWDYQRSTLYGKGLVFLEVKSIDDAQKAADELKDFIEKGEYKKIIRLYYNMMGLIELKRENLSLAIEYFERAIALLPSEGFFGYSTAIYLDSFALAYYKMKDLEKAKEQYEIITTLTTGRLDYGNIYTKSFYMLGKIHEQQGDTAKAIEHYEKFLTLWKNADPGIADVEDARKRLTGLSGN